MLCPQCSAPMVCKEHYKGAVIAYYTLNCTHCKFIIFYRGPVSEDD